MHRRPFEGRHLVITLLQQSIHPSAFWPEPLPLLTVYQVTAVTYTVEAQRRKKRANKEKETNGKSFYLEIKNLIDFTISF